MNQDCLLAKTRIHLNTFGLSPDNVDNILLEMKCNDLLPGCNLGDLRNDYNAKKVLQRTVSLC